jgi:hypothetical protein
MASRFAFPIVASFLFGAVGCASVQDTETSASAISSVPDIQVFRDQATQELAQPRTFYERNQRINAKYAATFLSDPKQYPWFGAAMHASFMVGIAIGITERILDGLGMDKPLPPWSVPLAQELSSLPRDVVEGIHAGLSEGNINVFMNVYPAVLAYRSGGIGALATLRDRGQLDQNVYDGFLSAERGDFRASVHSLLLEEQTKTLPPAFENPNDHLDLLTIGTCMTYNDLLVPLDCFAPWTLLHTTPFPNVADTKQRMAWVAGNVEGSYATQFTDFLDVQLDWARTRGQYINCEKLLECDE